SRNLPEPSRRRLKSKKNCAPCLRPWLSAACYLCVNSGLNSLHSLNMPAHDKCPRCQTAIPANAPQGLCPSCLLETGINILNNPRAAIESAIPIRPGKPKATTTLRDYELVGEIARGGMGIVFRARQISLNRIVAV